MCRYFPIIETIVISVQAVRISSKEFIMIIETINGAQ